MVRSRFPLYTHFAVLVCAVLAEVAGPIPRRITLVRNRCLPRVRPPSECSRRYAKTV